MEVVRADDLASISYGRLIFAATVVNLQAIVFGEAIAFTSPALPDIAINGPFNFTSEQTSWIGSVYTIGALVGALTGSYISDKRGHKFAIFHSALVCAFGWLIIAAAWIPSCLYVGRFLTGYSAGVVQASVPVYLGEVTPAKLRGLFTSLYGLCLSVGILLINLLGCFLHWRWLAVSVNVLLAVHTCLMVFVPESPRYLLSHGQRDKAVKSYDWFHPNCDPKELRDLEADMMDGGECKQAGFADLRHKRIYMPMLLTGIVWVVQITTGIDYVWFYTVQILNDSGVRLPISSNVEAVLISVMCVLGGILSSFLFDRSGRRVLLIVSGVVSAFWLFALGVYFKLHESNPAVAKRLALLPVTAIAAFQFFYSIGLAAGPGVVFSELIPTRARRLGSGVACFFCWTSVFIVTKLGVTLTNSTDVHQFGVFFILASCTVAGVIFIFFCLPETKGKTLEEIEKLFK